MRRNGLFSLIFIVVLAVGGLGGTLAAGNAPLLGLDLQGGVSVVLQPSEDADPEAVGQAINIIRQRVDAIGVAEPEIARQGDAIVVQLPGVKDRDRALELVGQTAELRFRPVLTAIPGGVLEADPDAVPDVAEDVTETETEDVTETETDELTPTTGGDEVGYGLAPGEHAAPLQADDTTTTVAIEPTETEPTETEPAETEPAETEPAETEPTETTETEPTRTDDTVPGLGGFELTPPEEDIAEEPVTLAEYDDDGNEVFRYQLGPTAATGEILAGASAQLQGLGTWVVGVEVKRDRIDEFNDIAAQCFNRAPTCPSGQLAIVLDSRVVSAPSINAPSFNADEISISGSFTEAEAKDLALVLRYGSLPVELEPQQTQSISASLGRDALDAGVVAGLIGMALVALYMFVYYRLLGLVAILSLSVSAALLWSMVAFLGENQGLALTLAGVTGLIVSIGVAVDSNVVFYEHLKEEVSKGRTLRSAIDGSFASAFATIVKADVASLIGAAILYWLTVGPVRGFALFLGLATLLDLITSYFFMRPLALLLVRSKRLQDRPRMFGMPSTAVGTTTTGTTKPTDRSATTEGVSV